MKLHRREQTMLRHSTDQQNHHTEPFKLQKNTNLKQPELNQHNHFNSTPTTQPQSFSNSSTPKQLEHHTRERTPGSPKLEQLPKPNSKLEFKPPIVVSPPSLSRITESPLPRGPTKSGIRNPNSSHRLLKLTFLNTKNTQNKTPILQTQSLHHPAATQTNERNRTNLVHRSQEQLLSKPTKCESTPPRANSPRTSSNNSALSHSNSNPKIETQTKSKRLKFASS
ncbi:hypothetical protein Droror1_Dr00016271 [Drosera rotundifolia]